MSIRDKTITEVRLKGCTVMEIVSTAVPSIGHEIIVGKRLLTVRRVIWGHDPKNHYDAWVQTICDHTGDVAS